ncbi:MAG: HAD-IA family hydrolase [Alistipes sp.]|nr:HAD-IA family hydrolase [Alistipes sp.]
MERKPVRLLLCDFDGTLVDTRMANALAYIETLREVGIELSVEEYLATYFGMRCNEFMRRMGIEDPAERERLRLRKIALYPTYFDTLRLNEALWHFAQSVRRQGGKLWIVSTGSRANIDNVINHLGIGEGIDGILSGLEIERPKPAPDCFLEVLRREGCSKEEALIFEDSPVGLAAAEASGIPYFKVDFAALAE